MANFLQFALELITVCMFLIIDHIIYILLDIVRDNAKIEYIQDGEHVLVIDVSFYNSFEILNYFYIFIIILGKWNRINSTTCKINIRWFQY